MMKPGQLFRNKKLDFEVRYGLVNINNKILIDYWNRRALPVGILMFLEQLDYSKETSTVTGSVTAIPTAAAMATSMAMAMATSGSTGSLIGKQRAARKEFKETGKIPGGLFLNGDGRKIWISHYDQKELMKGSQ